MDTTIASILLDTNMTSPFELSLQTSWPSALTQAPPPPAYPPPAPLPRGYAYPATGVYEPPPNTHFTEVPLSPDEVAIIGTIIGRGGFYFKRITEAARVHYIYYKEDRAAIEVWGPEFRLQNAVDRIKRRIEAAKEVVANRLSAARATDEAMEELHGAGAVDEEGVDTPF